MDRLFVPLLTGPFEDFRDFGKKYEIRSCSRNFKPEYVFSGRDIELRKGYSKRLDLPQREWQLWGNLGEVIVGCIEKIFERVAYYKLIMPREVSEESAIEKVKDMIRGDQSYIGFEVLLD